MLNWSAVTAASRNSAIRMYHAIYEYDAKREKRVRRNTASDHTGRPVRSGAVFHRTEKNLSNNAANDGGPDGNKSHCLMQNYRRCN